MRYPHVSVYARRFVWLLFVAAWALGMAAGRAAEATPELAAAEARARSAQGVTSFIQSEVERARKEALADPPAPLTVRVEDALPPEYRVDWYAAVSAANAVRQEAVVKFQWLENVSQQLDQKIAKAKAERDPEVQKVMLKEIQHDTELAERLGRVFVTPADPPPKAAATIPVAGRPSAPAVSTAQTAGEASNAGMAGAGATVPPLNGFSSGLLRQVEAQESLNMGLGQQSDPATARQRAVQEFGEGRAGAGGVSLHTAARLEGGFDVRAISGAVVEDGRLVLRAGERKIPLPTVPADFLAVALRNVIGGEGDVAGVRTGESDEVIVVQTGADRYGEVAWRKKFLATPVPAGELGAPVRLPLGPAVGILSLPQPNLNRVTYYGTIQDTRMGRVLMEADALIFQLQTGFELSGQAARLPAYDGFATVQEMQFRQALATPPAGTAPVAMRPVAVKPAEWWQTAGWMVWHAESVTLKAGPGASEIEPGSIRMALAWWAGNPDAVSEQELAWAKSISDHYGELKELYPALADLEEAARTVAMVRWVKSLGVPVDLKSAGTPEVPRVTTPATIPALSIFPKRDAQGKIRADRPAPAEGQKQAAP